MSELLIQLTEKQAWAMCQQHLAQIEGNDAKDAAHVSGLRSRCRQCCAAYIAAWRAN